MQLGENLHWKTNIFSEMKFLIYIPRNHQSVDLLRFDHSCCSLTSQQEIKQLLLLAYPSAPKSAMEAVFDPSVKLVAFLAWHMSVTDIQPSVVNGFSY